MGDIKSLLERAEESIKGKDAEKTARKLMSGKFNLNDMYEQMNMISGWSVVEDRRDASWWDVWEIEKCRYGSDAG